MQNEKVKTVKRCRDWLIERERSLRYVVVSLLVVVFVLQWVRAGLRLEDGDFYLHWQFGRRFAAHTLLYADGLHTPYPPFWAMAWSPVAVLPLAAAKLVCYPMSAAALGLLLYLLHRLTQKHLPLSGKSFFWTTTGVLLILSRFLVRELPECGPNLFLLALCWLAIFLWTERRDLLAGGCLGLAIALKCTPGLLLAYFAWKRQWRFAASAAVAAVAFTLAPALWQGPTDYARHMQIWLTQLRLGAGQADPSLGVLGPETLQNLSLRPALARGLMRLPAGHVARLDHPWYIDFLDLPPRAAGWIAKFALLALLAAVAWTVRGPLVGRDDPVVLWQCAAVGVLALLLSPITWYQHCVALVPPFYLLAREAVARRRATGWAIAVAVLFITVHLVLSRGLIGRDLTLLMASYHLTTWTLLVALLATLRGRQNYAPRWLGQRLADVPARNELSRGPNRGATASAAARAASN
ncbi:MAG TPA: glycosyltransferase family 87 protein [Pirellulales bacterium]|nr:glycosyltransferase family 87 protein [Pirellulales bacterium]